MVIKNHPVTFRRLFLRYLAVMAVTLFAFMIVPYIIYSIGINMGLYTYANSAEVSAKAAQNQIENASEFNESLVPSSSTFVFVSNDKKVISTNMTDSEKVNALNFLNGSYNPTSVNDCYLIISRHDGNVILHYYVGSRYTLSWMNRYLPNSETLLIIICIIAGIVGLFLVTSLFAKWLKKQFRPLTTATEKIKEQDLDFVCEQTSVKEFNDFLLSFSDMKDELKNSLETQWKMEQTKKEQTSALAHDIKTPLTIIKGNAELLRDSELTDEQKEYNGYILKNTSLMESYLRTLIDLTKAQGGFDLKIEKQNTESFLNELFEQANGLATPKSIKINLKKENLPKEFSADRVLLERALMNIISNAVDFIPENSEIHITAAKKDKTIAFTVEDSGKGFSKEDLLKATSQFYMGDKKRGANSHFGIGLYTADTIIKKHSGTLTLENSDNGGAKVTVEIPYSEKQNLHY